METEGGINVELVRRIAAGETGALAEFYDATAPVVYGLISRIVLDTKASEAVVLETYLQAAAEAAAYQPEQGNPQQWVARMARARAVVRRFENAVAAVPLGPLAVRPPEHLREEVLAQAERQPPATPSAPPLEEPPRELVQEARPLPPEPVPFLVPPPAFVTASGPGGGFASRAVPWILVAAVIAVAAFAFYRWKQADESSTQLQRMIAAAQGDAQQLRSVVEIERNRARDLEQISSAIGTPGLRIIQLVGQEAAPAASAVIFWDVQNSQWTVAGRLPPPPAGRAYQLWFVTPTTKTSAAVLKTDTDGRTYALIDVPPTLEKISGAAVTLESAGGTSQPTQPFYAIGKTP